MDAVSELTTLAYRLETGMLDVPRLQGPLVCLPRPKLEILQCSPTGEGGLVEGTG
jgi:hypothetical protein